MNNAMIKIFTLTSLIVTTSAFADTKKELDKSTPQIAQTSAPQSSTKAKAFSKRLDKASPKSSNPLHKPQATQKTNPMHKTSGSSVSPKDITSGKSTGKRGHEKGSGMATGKRTHEKGAGRTTGVRQHQPKK